MLGGPRTRHLLFKYYVSKFGGEAKFWKPNQKVFKSFQNSITWGDNLLVFSVSSVTDMEKVANIAQLRPVQEFSKKEIFFGKIQPLGYAENFSWCSYFSIFRWLCRSIPHFCCVCHDHGEICITNLLIFGILKKTKNANFVRQNSALRMILRFFSWC